jgi:hypothetical protein
MNKCKCIKKFIDPRVNFTENLFYEFEYIPTMSDYPANYRVYHDLGCFRTFSLIEFKQYFQTY